MITIIRDIYPDEILYSWISRYHKFSGNLLLKDTLDELFGKKKSSLGLGEVFGLNTLCDRTSSILGFTPEYIIKNHTLIPMFKPFLTLKRYNLICESIKGSGGKEDKFTMKANGEYEFNTFKICSKCISDDKLKYGETYLHRSHQIFGVNYCNVHGTQLKSLRYNKEEIIDVDKLSLDDLIEKEAKPIIINKDIGIKIANDLNSILKENSLTDHTLHSIKDKYKHMLIRKNYWINNGSVMHKNIVRDFIEFNTIEFLETFNLIPNQDANINWIMRIVKNRKDTLIHPFKYLLFIYFAFGNLDKFVNYDVTKSLMLDNGPWPCFNKCCPQYKKEVIDIYKFQQRNNTGYTLYGFECLECGMIYTRRVFPNKEDDKFKLGRVLSYGHLWEKKLKDLVNKETLLTEIAESLGCSRTTVKLQASKLSIEIGNYTEVKKRKSKTKVCNYDNSEILNIYRSRLQSLINSEEEVTKSDLQKLLTKEYTYLYRNDKEWLKKHIPQSISIQKGMDKYFEGYWSKKDLEISKKVENSINRMLKEEKVIKLAYIATDINYYGIKNKVYREKMPITEEILNRFCTSIRRS
ncbi:MAG: TnsD family Tn7-like transposition protein [Clostridium sp.]|uniref:TnsD family Tn7-like transposition protein n=1 Tax=Clostridium sp. TaxID=1506 RepID=UPI002FCA1CC4